MPAIRDFATWAPLLAILWGSQQGVEYAGGYVDGQADYRGGFGWHMSPGLQHMSTAFLRAVAEQIGSTRSPWCGRRSQDARKE